jgi:thioredoxin 1
VIKKLPVILLLAVVLIACKKDNKENTGQSTGSSVKDTVQHKIEFIELGSVNCIPCKKMQPVMKSIEIKYKGLVKVTFHDVWKEKGVSEKYGIDLIPTQVFTDASGKELMRHEGFFPEEEIDKFLQSQGVYIP